MKRWAVLVFVVLAISGLPACGDSVIGNCSGGMSYFSTYIVEVKYVTDYYYAGVGFTVTASQDSQEFMSGTTNSDGITMVYVMQPGATQICASKTGFAKKCKSFDSVLGNVTLVKFIWQKQTIQEAPDTPVQFDPGG